MVRNRLVACSVFFSVFILMAVDASADAYKNIFFNKIDAPYHCDSRGICFSLGVIQFKIDNWRDAGFIAQQVEQAPSMNFRWDDEWYHHVLPDSTNEVLVLFWKLRGSVHKGWVAIKNTPDAWYYYSDIGGPWRKLGNGNKVNIYWGYMFGSRNAGDRTGSLSIDLRNPENEGAWTGNHIWVSFGM